MQISLFEHLIEIDWWQSIHFEVSETSSGRLSHASAADWDIDQDQPVVAESMLKFKLWCLAERCAMMEFRFGLTVCCRKRLDLVKS